MERQLATVQTISELTPIEGADSIENAKVLGWHVVVKKGDFKVSDPCVYVEIDSILPPDNPAFEFMKERKYRVRTIRLRKQISQGICFPVSLVTDKGTSVKIGDDVTELLGIKKWEPEIPACLAGKVIGSFPGFIPKTDETRVQLLQDVLTRYKDEPCYVSEKLDGTSATYFVRGGEFGVCSRNLQLAETEGNVHWDLAKELGIKEKLLALNKNIAIQGEIFGNGVQKNPLKVSGKQIRFFNVVELDKYEYLSFAEFSKFIGDLGLQTVPILETNYLLDDNIDNLVKKAAGKSALNPQVDREGIVIRPLVEKLDLQMSKGVGSARVSFKAISPEYLLKNDG